MADAGHTASLERFSYRHASPQVLDGSPPTAADDIWSLGSTVFTLLDGRAPFATDDPADDTALAYLGRVRRGERRVLRRDDVPDRARRAARGLPVGRPRGSGRRWRCLRQQLGLLSSEQWAWQPGAAGPGRPTGEPAAPVSPEPASSQQASSEPAVHRASRRTEAVAPEPAGARCRWPPEPCPCTRAAGGPTADCRRSPSSAAVLRRGARAPVSSDEAVRHRSRLPAAHHLRRRSGDRAQHLGDGPPRARRRRPGTARRTRSRPAWRRRTPTRPVARGAPGRRARVRHGRRSGRPGRRRRLRVEAAVPGDRGRRGRAAARADRSASSPRSPEARARRPRPPPPASRRRRSRPSRRRRPGR